MSEVHGLDAPGSDFASTPLASDFSGFESLLPLASELSIALDLLFASSIFLCSRLMSSFNSS